MALFDLPSLVWPGRYSDGRTAAQHAVDGRIAEDGLAIESETDSLAITWPFDQIRLIDGPDELGTIHLARFGSEARLTLQHRDALAALEMRCVQLHDGMGGESSWRVIAAWCGAAAVAVALVIFAVIPFVASHAAQFVSPQAEAALGERLASFVMTLTVDPANKARPECDDPRGRFALDKLLAPLTAQLTLRNPAHVQVVNSRMINALALPGGQILLFRGLLDFAEGPNEVAGVLAHELGHLKLDHPLTLVIRDSGTAFVVGLVLGDVFGGTMVAVAGTGILDTAFSRDAESAADKEAVALMTGAGFDVQPFGAFFERMTAKELDGDLPIAFLRTHPPGDQRAKLIEAAPAGGGPALTAAAWADLKAICE